MTQDGAGSKPGEAAAGQTPAGMGGLARGGLRALRTASIVLDRLHEALDLLAAALLPRPLLLEMIRAEWEGFADVTREPDPRLFAWEREFYGRFLAPAGSRTLLVGCGTGRELIALAEAGHDVEGLDLAPGAVETCRCQLERQRLHALVHVGSMEWLPPRPPFDLVIYSWWCFGYLPGAAARRQALQAARGALHPEGRILISYLLREGAAPPALALRLARRLGSVARSGWAPEPGDAVQLLGARGPIGLHFEHRFTREEIEEEARLAGLAIVAHDVDDFGRIALGSHPLDG